MVIEGKKIAHSIEKVIVSEIKNLNLKTPLKLTVFLVGKGDDQLHYIKIKKKTAKRLGIQFELIHIKKTPKFENFARTLKEKSTDKKTTGVVIQHPLPARLQTDTLYNFIPEEKEIEGHHKKSLFYPPIGLAVLTVLKYVYLKKIYQNKAIETKDILIRPHLKEKFLKKQLKTKLIPSDKFFFKETFKNKRIVLVGRGPTGGKPIGKTLTLFKINYINLNSTTPNPEKYYKEADIIITAVGKKVINPDDLKPGVILINVGLRKENNQLKGDYEENEIKETALYYTPTPGGVGPIDIAYLYKNLLEAAKLQLAES